MTDFQVTGADDFHRLSKALKAAGRTELRKQLNKALRDAAKPLIEDTQRALAAALPPGLAARGEATKQVVKVKTGRDPGVTLGVQYGGRGRGLGASNAQLANRTGQVRHPLFGDTRNWFNTPVPSAQGWFDDTVAEAAPKVRPHLEAALEDIAQQVVRGVR